MLQAYNHCADLVRTYNREAYGAVLFAPEHKRAHLFALQAFHLEIARICAEVSDPMPGEVRLEWWREVLQGEGRGDINNHPVVRALLSTITAHNLPVSAFIDYLDARVFDLYDDPMPTLEDLEAYCGQTCSALFKLSALILDETAANTPTVNEAAGYAGVAKMLTAILVQITCNVHSARAFIPEEWRVEGDTEQTEAFARLCQHAQKRLDDFMQCRKNLPPQVEAAFKPMATTTALLDKIKKRQEPTLSPLRRCWLMWQF